MAFHKNRLIKDTVVPGTTSRINIPRQHFLHRLNLFVVLGALTGGSSPAFVAQAVNKVIQSIRLTIGGQIVKENLSFEDLQRLNILQYKGQPDDDGYAYLDLGRLPTMGFTSLELEFDYAALSAYTTGAPTGMTGAYVDVRRIEELNEGQSVKGIPLVLHKTKQVTAALVTQAPPVDLRSGNVLAGVLIVPSVTDLVQTIDVIQDGVKYHLATEVWNDLREENKADFSLNAKPAEFAFINFDKLGEGSQALRTGEMNTLEMVFNTDPTKSGTIRVVTVEVATPQ